MGEAAEFEGWEWYLEDAHLIHSPDEPKPWFKPKYVTRTEKDVPLRTTEQEIDLMNQQLQAYEGFDIDYTQFRCLFNYHPVDFNAKEFVEEPETNVDLLNRLCQKSLDGYNQENKTEYEFVKPLYANFHMSAGVMFLITFLVKDPADDTLTKQFQARVHYSFHYDSKFVFCRSKPPLQLVSTDEDSLGDAEKDQGWNRSFYG
ncbi:hypothetical protein AALP_AA2G007000 [Arabis alpina]|uniref:Cystatin domain-containing protein n=1 Tax=Arabis alpina TaxID=50452 RepID=A0A087HEH3_ARAAL|nr:hypothetical protein AALP_AA2G007000 [Arabis alpina]